MSDIIQYLLAGLIVAAAVVAVERTIVSSLKNRQSALTACVGCKLQDICQKPEKNTAKKCGDKVAQVKKSK